MGAGTEALRRAWEHDSAGREGKAVVEYWAAFEALFRADAPGMVRYERAIRGYSAEL